MAPSPQPQTFSSVPGRGPGSALLRVLMIEDDPIVADALFTLLEEADCEVVAAVNAEEAVEVSLRLSGVPELILADFRLPRADGLYAIEQVRMHHGSPIRACVISADETPGMRARMAALSCGFMRKPMKVALVMDLLDSVRGSSAAAA